MSRTSRPLPAQHTGLDPQVARFLEQQAELGLPPVNRGTVEEARRRMEESASLYGPREEIAEVRDADANGVPIRIYDPLPEHDLPLAVFVHGGGWVAGSIEAYEGPCRALANRAGCRVASVQYRLAPEHPFPAAVEDCWTATRWAAGHAPMIAVAGDSAGGNLAAVIAMRARNANLALALQVLIYPATDLSFDLETGSRYSSHERCGSGFGLTRAVMEWYRRHYLGDADGTDPEASPILASDLTGVASALVIVCDHDPLHDEGVAYGDLLRQAGVSVCVSDYEGLNHGVFRRAAVIDRARDLIDEVAMSLRNAFSQMSPDREEDRSP